MKWRTGYRTIVRASEFPFEGAVDGDPGFFNFDKWEKKYHEAFQLVVAFAFNAQSGPVDCRLFFEDPDSDNRPTTPGTAPQVMILDTVASGIGPLQYFYEDNLGQGFAVPWRERTELPYELHFEVADIAEGDGIFQLFLWWEPKFPSLQTWELLCRLPEMFGIDRSPGTGFPAQMPPSGEASSVMAAMLRAGKLPEELHRFVRDFEDGDSSGE